MLTPGAKTLALGAPSRAVTVIKVGRLITGRRIPVVTDEEALCREPTHALILSWYFSNEVIDVWRGMGYAGCCITAPPHVTTA